MPLPLPHSPQREEAARLELRQGKEQALELQAQTCNLTHALATSQAELRNAQAEAATSAEALASVEAELEVQIRRSEAAEDSARDLQLQVA